MPPLGASVLTAAVAAAALGVHGSAKAVEAAAVAARPASETRLLDVVINGNRVGQIGEFTIRDGALFTRREELRSLGFKIPDSVPLTADGLIALSRLRGVSVRVDEPSQTVFVAAADEWLTPTVLGAPAAAGNYAVESGTGATLNYDVTATSIDGRISGSGFFDGRVFSRLGVLSSGLLVYERPRTADSHGDVVRLDTTYVYSDPASMRRYRLGDFISGALTWTRAVRMVGAQVNSDFSMRPDLITFPVPSISGSAAVPSTVDVLVNGTHTVSGPVSPGPFEVRQVPVVTGAGTVEMTVTDALGRQVATELPFYASPLLLAQGLQTYSGEIGFVRRNWGIVSNDYGSFAGVLTYRRGLSSNFTIEGRAEHTQSLTMAGIGGVLNLWNFAIANLAFAGSTNGGRTGGEFAAGLQRLTRHYNIGGSVIVASRDFGDIAAKNGDPISTLQLNLNAGVSLKNFGSFGIAYTDVKRLEAGSRATVAPGIDFGSALFPVGGAEHLKLLSGSYSRELGNIALFATVFHDFGNQKATSVTLGLTVPLGPRTSASGTVESASGKRSGQIEMSRNATGPGEWGFRLYASGVGGISSQAAFVRNATDREFGDATYKGQWGQLFAGVDRFGGQTTLQAELRGGLSFMNGSLFASNWIDDSFAVVDTTGVSGIRVRDENRDVGRTNSSGRLLVADLRSFQPNHLSIDALDAPVDATVTITDWQVRPQDRAGVVVKFPVKISHGALLKIVDAAGEPLPVGSSATLRSSGVAAPVGYDGEAYITGLEEHNEVLVQRPDERRCVVHFNFNSIANQIPTIGPLRCGEVAP